jgi:predicted molibdopterin-dependent oxidoreductase YjgC
MANITVDGQAIEAQDGAPLVEVLKNNGFYISSLCYIDGLKPYAGCRTCLVDIEGPPGLQLSCTAIVQDGMVVRTATDEVKEARKSVLSIILANHSDRCLTCHRREHCHPGDICLRDDVVTHRCLTCSKNYRCELQATCEMLGMSGYEPWVGEERGFYTSEHPPADRANPFMEFDPQMCIICTRCQRACDEKRHTGAITLSGKGWDTRIAFGAGGPIHDSNCDFSGACIDVCPTAALMEHPNKWVAKPETWTSTTCDSCAVGCSLLVGSRDGRGVIVRPGSGNDLSGDQICVRGRYHYDSLKPRERLQKHTIRRGAIQVPSTFDDAITEAVKLLQAPKGKVGVLVGNTVTNEEAMLASLIASALNTKADSSLGPVVRAAKEALEARLGTWRMAADATRIAKAKAIVVVHDDIEETHNVVSVRIKDAAVRQRAKVVVVGSLRSELVDFATAWIRPEGGQEGQAADALARALGGETSKNPDIADAVAQLEGVAREDTIVVCAPHSVSPPLAAAMTGGAANVAVALFGDAASENLVVLPPAVNTHGLLDTGLMAEGASNPLEGLGAALIVRDDPTLQLPGGTDALAKLNGLVVLENVLSDTAKAANVVLAEGRAYASAGTYTQGDFRVQKLEPAIAPEGDARPLYDVLLAIALGLGIEVPATPDAALGEIAKANAEYMPAWDMLVGEGIRLDVKGSGTGKTVPVDAAPLANEGLQLVTSRDLYTAEDAARAHHPEAEKLHRYDKVQLSEEDGDRLGIATGDEIELSAGGFAIRAEVTVTERIPAGAVFVSSLLQGGVVARFLDAEGTLPAVSITRTAQGPVSAAAQAASQAPATA